MELTRRGFLFGATAAVAAIVTPFEITKQVLKVAKPAPSSGLFQMEIVARASGVKIFQGELDLPKGLSIMQPDETQFVVDYEIIDGTTFGSNFRQKLPGVRSYGLNFSMMTNSIHWEFMDALKERRSTTIALRHGGMGVIVGDFAIMQATISTYGL